MNILRIGTININPTVGAVFSNSKKMKQVAHELLVHAPDTDVVSFSELCVCGYPPEDLIQWPDFIAAQYEALADFVENAERGPIYLVGAAIEHEDNIYNSVVVIYDGTIQGIVPKEKLPTYGVFYDGRTFTAGNGYFGAWNPSLVPFDTNYYIPFGDMIFEAGDKFVFGTEVCEDGWTPDGPGNRRSYQGAEVIFNLSASPWRPGVHYRRRRMLGTRSADNAVGMVYTNQIGGNDSLVFDGGTYVYEAGAEIAIKPRWMSNIFNVVDLNLGNIRRERNTNTTWRLNRQQHEGQRNVSFIPFNEKPHPTRISPTKPAMGITAAQAFVGSMQEDLYAVNEIEDMRQAILLGMGDYFAKAAPFEAEVVSLSGGRDSTLVLIYAAENARKRYGFKADLAEHVFAYSMPTRFNSEDTKSIARDVAEALGVSFNEMPIETIFESEKAVLEEVMGHPLTRLAKQNLQARIRAERVRTIANAKNALLWQTGSMSEKATGYTTLGGDMEGDYSPLSDVPKTVEELLLFQELNIARKSGNAKLAEVIQRMLEETIASAELEENQDDQSELAPFPVIDVCFSMFFGEKMGYKDILEQIEDRLDKRRLLESDANYQEKLKPWVENCIKRFMRSVFKWVQMCQGIHLLDVDLDRERALQVPTVQSLEWLKINQ